MRHPLRTARRLTNGRAIAAASLAGVIAVTGSTTLAHAEDEPVVLPLEETPVAAEAALTEAEDFSVAGPVDVEVDAAARTEARGVVLKRQLTFRAKVAKVRTMRSRIVTIAKNQIGDRYRLGSSGPDAFDCSGLVRYVYKKATGRELPHQSRAQYARVKKIKKSQAHPGDLVFFFRNGAHHVAVYVGNNKIVHARGYGKPVATSSLSSDWSRRHVTGFGRIIEEPRPA